MISVYIYGMHIILLIFNKLRHLAIGGVKKLFKTFGIGVISYKNLINLRKIEVDRSRFDLQFILALGSPHYDPLITLLEKSKSQLRQDLFVLSENQYKKGGFFVEFGACNGIIDSNTYLLEKEFSWTGILVEPAKIWKMELHNNRPNSTIDNLCIWKDSQSTLIFNEAHLSGLSTIDIFSNDDSHKMNRLRGKKYEVQTISLTDLLIKHNAPKYIDYLSIDTEGSEYEILHAFDFREFTFGIITVEHNHTFKREKIFTLLTRNGYKRKFEDISYFDDWYTK